MVKPGVQYIEPYPPEYIRIETAKAIGAAKDLRREVETFLHREGYLASGPAPFK